jgi:hypothetical protein
MIARRPTSTRDGTLNGQRAHPRPVSDDGRVVLGAAVLLEAPHADGAREVLAADPYVGGEVHEWQFGRPG